MKTRFILGSALAAVLLMWGGTGKVCLLYTSPSPRD